MKNLKAFFILLTLFIFFNNGEAGAYNSKAWKERLLERTAVMWIDGQSLGEGIVLNARGELNVTWLERGLSRVLGGDRYVDEWVLDGLGYYSSSRGDTRAKVKGRDVLMLRYAAVKHWDFDPCKLTVGGYAVKPEDILTREEYWERALIPGSTGAVAVAVPPLKPGEKLELRYEDASAEITLPRRAR